MAGLEIALNVESLRVTPNSIIDVRSDTVLDAGVSTAIQKEIRDRLPADIADTPVLVCDPGVDLVRVHMGNLCKTVFCSKVQKGVGSE